MPVLRATHNGEAYEIEISRASGSPSDYQCRVRKGDHSEKQFRLEVISRIGSRWTIRVDDKIEDLVISRHDGQFLIDWDNRNYRLSIADLKDIHDLTVADHAVDQNVIRAEMTGKVVTVGKEAGDSVEKGEALATIEAMKMLNQIKSPKAGRVRMCHVEAGNLVNPGDVLFEIE